MLNFNIKFKKGIKDTKEKLFNQAVDILSMVCLKLMKKTQM